MGVDERGGRITTRNHLLLARGLEARSRSSDRPAGPHVVGGYSTRKSVQPGPCQTQVADPLPAGVGRASRASVGLVENCPAGGGRHAGDRAGDRRDRGLERSISTGIGPAARHTRTHNHLFTQYHTGRSFTHAHLHRSDSAVGVLEINLHAHTAVCQYPASPYRIVPLWFEGFTAL